jgi:hypothetical protein
MCLLLRLAGLPAKSRHKGRPGWSQRHGSPSCPRSIAQGHRPAPIVQHHSATAMRAGAPLRQRPPRGALGATRAQPGTRGRSCRTGLFLARRRTRLGGPAVPDTLRGPADLVRSAGGRQAGCP